MRPLDFTKRSRLSLNHGGLEVVESGKKLEKKFSERGMVETRENTNTNFLEGKDFHFNSTFPFCLLQFLFYRNTRKGVTVRRRFMTFIVRVF